MRRLLVPILLAAGLLSAPAHADTYTITGLGREALSAEVARLAKYVRVAESKQIVTETGS